MTLTPKDVGARFLTLAQKLYDDMPAGQTPSRMMVKKTAYASGFVPDTIALIKEAFGLEISEIIIDDAFDTAFSKGKINAAAGFFFTSAWRSADTDRQFDVFRTFSSPYVPSVDPSIWASWADLRSELKSLGLDKGFRVPLVRYVMHLDKAFFNRKPDGQFNYTPEEFAAVMLHEIGHLNYYVTCGKALVYTKEMFHYTLSIPDDKATTVDLHRLVSACLENKSLSKKLRLYGTILLKTNIAPDDAAWHVYVAACTWFITSSMTDTMVTILDLFRARATLNEMDVGNGSLKSERAADNYAVAAGFGAPLVTGLIKAHQVREVLSIGEGVCTMYPPATSAIVDLFNPGNYDTTIESESSGYDPISVRLQKAVDGAKRALDQDDLDAESKAELMVQIQRAQKAITLYNSQTYVMIRKAEYLVFTAILKAGLFIPRLFTSQLSETARYFNTTSDTLRNNGLTYWAASLKST